ncbi:hypothetical protein ACFFJN_17470 [Erwinia mallotivora]|uniref:hypothetical protein n=1 Tax=Erwinia mallotivora TaxID=69222 RepID=UPI0035E83368
MQDDRLKEIVRGDSLCLAAYDFALSNMLKGHMKIVCHPEEATFYWLLMAKNGRFIAELAFQPATSAA